MRRENVADDSFIVAWAPLPLAAFWVGNGKTYRDFAQTAAALEASGAEIVTVCRAAGECHQSQ